MNFSFLQTVCGLQPTRLNVFAVSGKKMHGQLVFFASVSLLLLSGTLNAQSVGLKQAGIVSTDAMVKSQASGVEYHFLDTISQLSSPRNARVDYPHAERGSSTPQSPIQLTATYKGRDVLLNWEIDAASRAKGVTIEKSYDGRSFSALAAFAAPVSDVLPTSFNTIDPKASLAKTPCIYYRLRAALPGGAHEYSPVVVVPATNSFSVGRVFPTPDKNELQVNLVLNSHAVVRIAVANEGGEILAKHVYHPHRGATQLHVPGFRKLPVTGFLLSIEVNGEKQVVKVAD
ncbi:hypothetical protein EXU57_08470 [Segetibacter sp. 3557_3]|uniref:hypothetical protein n=1 Tax=Segetibacter sp. 3557_3 TaxID=2547429 RepID=UPI001058D6AC|nr:hypothetical protein [Segetibacter sp. 3557_3]TDH26834.1 hypothetical protein EXU57_08470 [Segetibacter sp. 3557_3]